MGRLGLLFVTSLVLVILVVACNSKQDDPNRILQLSEGSFSESHYRGMLRESIVTVEAFALLCDTLESLTDEQALQSHPTVSATVISYAVTPAPPQEPNPSDVKRATQLLRDECGNRPFLD